MKEQDKIYINEATAIGFRQIASMFETLKFYKKDKVYFTEKDFNHALKSRSYISKHHPQNFQKKVLNAFEQKVNEFI